MTYRCLVCAILAFSFFVSTKAFAAQGDGGTNVDAVCAPFNGGAGCSATEAFLVNKSPDCYSCLANADCLDDTLYGDVGNECGDSVGAAAAGAQAGMLRSDLCMQTLACALTGGSECSIVDPETCYCGLSDGYWCFSQNNPDGACKDVELAALEHSANDTPESVIDDYYRSDRGGGKANAILLCAVQQNCFTCTFDF